MGSVKETGKCIAEVGVDEYKAPEMIGNSQYTEKVDEWNLGIILFEMLVGHLPFTGSKAEVKAKIKKTDVQFLSPDWKFVSIEAKDLI